MKPKAALDFLKTGGPVGARDTRTLTKLKEMGVPTYFSGCLTLTWNPDIRRLSPKPRKEVVVVDTSSGKQGVTTLVPEALLEDSRVVVNLGGPLQEGLVLEDQVDAAANPELFGALE